MPSRPSHSAHRIDVEGTSGLHGGLLPWEGGGPRTEPEKSLCGPPRGPEAQSLRRPRCGFLRDTNAIQSA